MAASYKPDLEQWALPQLNHLLPLSEDELRPVINYVEPLSNPEASAHLQDLLGDTPEAVQFIAQFIDRRDYLRGSARKQMSDEMSPTGLDRSTASGNSSNANNTILPISQTGKGAAPPYPPPARPPPAGGGGTTAARNHTNPVIEAARIRAQDEVKGTDVLMGLSHH